MIAAALVGLQDFPELGSLRPDLGEDVRVRIVRPHIIVYRYRGDTIHVARVIHQHRNLEMGMLLFPDE